VIHGDGCRDGKVFVFVREPHRGHHEQPVRVDATRLVRLGAADHDAVGSPLHHVHEQVLVLLLVGRLAAVALDIGHRAAEHEILLLHLLHEVAEARVVLRAVRLVHVERHGEQRIGGVHADAALKARPGALTEPALHAVLHHDVVHALRHMQEAIHARAGDRRRGRGQLGVFLGEAIGVGDRVDGGSDHWVIDWLGDELSEQVHLQLPVSQARDVLVRSANRHG
jgi:hypothetical protein